MENKKFVHKVLLVQRDLLTEDEKPERIFYNLGFGCINIKVKNEGELRLQDLLAIFIKDSSFAHYVKLDNFKIKDVIITRDGDKIYLKPSSDPGSLLVNINMDSKNGITFKGKSISIPFWSVPYLISIQYNYIFNVNKEDEESYQNLFFNTDCDIQVNQIYKDNKEILSRYKYIKKSIEKLDEKIENMKLEKDLTVQYKATMDSEILYLITNKNEKNELYCMEEKYNPKDLKEYNNKEINGYLLLVSILLYKN